VSIEWQLETHASTVRDSLDTNEADAATSTAITRLSQSIEPGTEPPGEFSHFVADIFLAKPIGALWDWARAIGPPDFRGGPPTCVGPKPAAANLTAH
jgi:hypothetical protein